MDDGERPRRKRAAEQFPRRAWRAEENARLTAMVVAGVMTRAEIAADLGRSAQAVKVQMHKLGVRFAPEVVKARIAASMVSVRADPAYRAAVGAGIKASWTPERRRAISERCSRLRLWESGQAKLAANPAAMARRAAKARANLMAYKAQAVAWCPPEWRDRYYALSAAMRNAKAARKQIRRLIAQEAGARHLQALAAAKLAWCPLEYRALYRTLTVSKKMTAAAARAMVLAQINADAVKARAIVHPAPARPRRTFEELLAAAQRGEVVLVERVALWRPPTEVPGGASVLAGVV